MAQPGSRSFAVSGEIGDDAPVARKVSTDPPVSGPLLLSLRDDATDLARGMRRSFRFVVGQSGGLAHYEEPGAQVSSLLRHAIDAPDVLAPLRVLVAGAGLDRLPAEFGSGTASVQLEWRGEGAPQVRTLRWRRSGAVRDFDGVPVTRGLVDLLDGLVALLDWVDRQGPAPRWPAHLIPQFPDADLLLQGRRAARLCITHDWDGAARHDLLRELVVTDDGVLHHRTFRHVGGGEQIESARVDSGARPQGRAVMERIAALDPASFRRNIGFSSGSCPLDTTYTRIFDYFDGARVRTSTYVFGSERGIGTVLGDAPPTPREAQAFELLGELMRRG